MEDYDALQEMTNLEDLKIIAIIEDDERFIFDKLLDLPNVELMPIRHDYDLSNFSDEYIEKTKKLFTYYYNKLNKFDNEILRLKKHFVHYRRFPILVYIPLEEKNRDLIIMFEKLGINVCSDKRLILTVIGAENNNE